MKSWRIWLVLAVIAYMGLGLLVWRPFAARSRPVVINQTPVPPVPTLHPDAVAQGEALYQQHCAVCHGPELQGAPDWKSHWPTAVVDRQLARRQVPVHTLALLTGSVLPDIPFFLLTLLGEGYFRWFTATPTGESPMIYMHFTLFFTDPLWIISHNFFHAPFILGVLGLAGFAGVRWGQRWEQQWGRVLLWFAVGAGLHTFIDIFTHNSDGPLLLFPFNWRYRFRSPVSYWEQDNFGLAFTLLEHLLDVGILFYLFWQWRRHRQQRSLA